MIGIFIDIPGVLIFLLIMSFSVTDNMDSVNEPGTVHINYNSSEHDSLATQIILQEYLHY